MKINVVARKRHEYWLEFTTMNNPIRLDDCSYEKGEMLYGSFFDHFFSQSAADMERQIKLSAIFFKQVLLPDSFLLVRGFISEGYLSHLNNRTGSSYQLAELIREGIICPVIRAPGSTFSAAWQASLPYGLQPDKGIFLSRRETEMIVADVNKIVDNFFIWPNKMLQEDADEYRSRIHNHFLGAGRGSPIRHVADATTAFAPESREFARQALRFLEEGLKNKSFGRRHYEEFLVRTFGKHTFNAADYLHADVLTPTGLAGQIYRDLVMLHHIYQSDMFKAGPSVQAESNSSCLFSIADRHNIAVERQALLDLHDSQVRRAADQGGELYKGLCRALIDSLDTEHIMDLRRKTKPKMDNVLRWLSSDPYLALSRLTDFVRTEFPEMLIDTLAQRPLKKFKRIEKWIDALGKLQGSFGIQLVAGKLIVISLATIKIISLLIKPTAQHVLGPGISSEVNLSVTELIGSKIPQTNIV